MRGQVRAFTVILTVNTTRRSCEIFAGFRGNEEKPQLDKLVLDVVSFIFVRFWLEDFFNLRWFACVCTLPLRWVQSRIWLFVDNRPRSIYQYSSMAPGFWVKIANFSSFLCPSIPKRDLDTKKTTPNIEVWPERLGAMLEYWYIKRGLFTVLQIMPFALIWNINHLMNSYPLGRQVTLLRINLYVNWSGKNLSKLMTSVD